MTEEQIYLLRKLDSLKSKIQDTDDAEGMSYLIKAAIKEIEEKAPEKEIFNSEIEKMHQKGRNMYLKQLKDEEARLLDGYYPDFSTAQFQISGSIAQLMISISGAGIDEINRVLNKHIQ